MKHGPTLPGRKVLERSQPSSFATCLIQAKRPGEGYVSCFMSISIGSGEASASELRAPVFEKFRLSCKQNLVRGKAKLDKP
jgi:hypothetical protein